jgi:short-subunit dehydrogenase
VSGVPQAGTAVVTGAGRGLGQAIARMLARRGYTVAVTDVDEVTAKQAAEEIGGEAFALPLDVSDHAAVSAVRDEVVQRTGRLDLWVNNAGVLVTGPAWEVSPQARRLMVDVNAVGTMNGTLAALEHMRDHGGGHVVNVVSLAGLVAVAGEAVYAATKHAAIGFSIGTAADLRLAGVKDVAISCVCPDGIWTPMLHDKLDDPGAALSFSGSLLQPEDVVAAIEKVLDKPRMVTAVPAWRGAQVRLFDAMPRVALKVFPLVVAQGRRRQRRLKKKLSA